MDISNNKYFQRRLQNTLHNRHRYRTDPTMRLKQMINYYKKKYGLTDELIRTHLKDDFGYDDIKRTLQIIGQTLRDYKYQKQFEEKKSKVLEYQKG